jgi:hypothetical protein
MGRQEPLDSDDEALCVVLGLPSLDINFDVIEACQDHAVRSLDDLLQIKDSHIKDVALRYNLKHQYEANSFCIFPTELSVPPSLMRRLTDELTWGGADVQVDRSFETIRLVKNGGVNLRRTLTRFENFVNHHEEWNKLCRDYLCRLISVVVEEQYALFKEKLNLKPPGGSGFAPHLDRPSLRVALGAHGPATFLTVMIAIDDMKTENGCLKIVRGSWNERNACFTVAPEVEGSPDAGGRAGAIPLDVADEMNFEDIVVPAGTVVVFNAWAPHRSSPNMSYFPRRAVFLTYNPSEEGDFHDQYYERMTKLRDEWRSRNVTSDEKLELDSLATIPRI